MMPHSSATKPVAIAADEPAPQAISRDAESNSPPAKVWQKPVVPEHPKGPEIREQVEYYFSDKNLAGDEHLRTLIGGSQNLPVSISEILGWKRMRQYKPRSQVIEALKKSPFLEVIDNKRIKRLRPYIYVAGSSELVSYHNLKAKQAKGVEEGKHAVQGDVIAAIDGKSSKQPTGFEEFFAEGPISPDVFEEEEDLYSSSVPIWERLEVAMQRYCARRKFTKEHRKLFDEWMRFGGVDTGPRQFTGKMDKRELVDVDPYHKAHALATHRIAMEKCEQDKWELNFSEVAAGYLSTEYPTLHFDYTMDEATGMCKLMANFYNYLILHNVCPEYKDDILEAKRLVENAGIHELCLIRGASNLLPGLFNRACSYLFGGAESRMAAWYASTGNDDEPLCGDEGTRVIVTAAIATLGSDELNDWLEVTINEPEPDFEKKSALGSPTEDGFSDSYSDDEVDPLRANIQHFTFGPEDVHLQERDNLAKPAPLNPKPPAWTKHFKAIAQVTALLDIKEINPPTPETRTIYKAIATPKLALYPIGLLHCAPCRIEDGVTQYDLPPGKDPIAANLAQLPEKLVLWVEQHILETLRPGMKLDVELRKLDFGGVESVWVIEQLNRILCSFYRNLLNDLVDKPMKRLVFKEDGGGENSEGGVAADSGGENRDDKVAGSDGKFL